MKNKPASEALKTDGPHDARPRRRVVRFLALLSSEEALRLISGWMPPEKAAFEMCRAWFEKIYVPSDTYLDGLRGDRSQDAVNAFCALFDDEELSAMARFHRFFELRMAMVPESAKQAGRIPLTDSWQALVQHAAYLLEDLGIDGETARLEALRRLREADGRSEPLGFMLLEA